ncbi:hypothetical protein THAOC_18833 [Thalassiosira oceanica]|uniref:MULE transposase domain-containing protein n=1 Tax=Thalassiosira oceanica TaxID=159749 RepID=K0SIC8_THAOC|nr:hypothetical protein THAOC_18833 [Thalassiosira oceanica]|eukprot:EJK60761.1 hypothetical protein THAOC_18833 [Thalassiosira oceanica]
MKFTEFAVEKAAANFGTVASPSSLNRARHGFPQPYVRDYEHGTRLPGQVPPNYDGSYASTFGNYRAHPTAAPAQKDPRQNPYAAGSSVSMRFKEQISREHIQHLHQPSLARANVEHRSSNPATAAYLRPPPPRCAPRSAGTESADDYNLIRKTNNSLEDYNLSFDDVPGLESRHEFLHGAGGVPPVDGPGRPVRTPHPQELSMEGFERLPLQVKEAMAANAGTSIAGLEEIMRTTHAQDISERDAVLADAASSRRVPEGTRLDDAKADAKADAKPDAKAELEFNPSTSVFGGVGDAESETNGVARDALDAPTREDITDRQKDYIRARVDAGDIASAPDMWTDMVKHVNRDNPNFVGMDRTQTLKLISYLRTKDVVSGGELERLTQANMGSSFTATCRWNHSWAHPDGEHRTVGMAHPELLTAFVDATYVKPKNWEQCLIWSVHIPSLEINIPVYYVLMSHKTNEAYHDAIASIQRDTQFKMGLDAIVTDFEVALFSTLSLFFPTAIIIGCFFHFKQALKRRLEKLGVPEDQIHYAMRPGKLDTVVALPPNELLEVGFPYTFSTLLEDMERSSSVESDVNPEQWAPFFDNYMTGFWMRPPSVLKMWNQFSWSDVMVSLIGITNNPSEGYNRHFKHDVFRTSQPSLVQFFGTLNEELEAQVVRYNEFKSGARKRPLYKEVKLRKIPNDYWTCSFRQGAGLVGENPSAIDLSVPYPHKMVAPPAVPRTFRSTQRSYADVMAVYDSESEPLAKRSTKAIKRRRKSLKRLSLNTQNKGRDERAKKRSRK